MVRKVEKVADPASKERNQKWPQIFTADGFPMKVNDLVYACDYKESKWSENLEARVKVYRITKIDLRYRTVRMRCARGCETFLQLNQGCSIEKYYSKKESAEQILKDKIAESVAEISDHIEKKRKKLAKIKALKIAVDRTPPPEMEA